LNLAGQVEDACAADAAPNANDGRSIAAPLLPDKPARARALGFAAAAALKSAPEIADNFRSQRPALGAITSAIKEDRQCPIRTR
jgi:hypothetical protein